MYRFRARTCARLAVALAFAIGVAACNHENAPATPSTTPGSAASSAPGPANGATISGTVTGVASSSQVRTQLVPLTVGVTGTPLSSAVDGNGHFTLSDVPPGHVDLHFMGAGTDAHLALDNVAAHATLAITVRVSGNDAQLEDDHGSNPGPGAGDQASEVNGAVNAGSLAGSCAAHSLSFAVGSTRVTTNASTQFPDGTCDSLKAGASVEVKGARQPDNSIVAATVEIQGQNDDGNRNADAEMSGSILAGSLTGTCAANSLSFRVGATLVRTNAATQFNDTACTALKSGDTVEVNGSRQADGSLLASRVAADN